MKLAALQTAFQTAILGGAAEAPGSILPSRQQSADERFAIYTQAYRLRLAEFLATDFPVLRNALGDEDFGALVEAYIEATPSPHRNARWYARGLPEFMQSRPPWQTRKSAADLARFERALADAFDAADAEPIEATALAGIAPEDQPSLRFGFQPSVALLSVAKGTLAAYEAAAGDEATPFPDASPEEALLVWRGEAQQSFYRLLEENEVLALESAFSGATFAEICGFLSLRMPEEEAANEAAILLIRWFGGGLLTGLACDAA